MGENQTIYEDKTLTSYEIAQLEKQNSRLVDKFKANQLEVNAKKNWDLFFKRNETRFFKDRRWTTREFRELLGETITESSSIPKLFEIGCGVGNLIYPLIEDGVKFKFYACDLSTKALELLKKHRLYNNEMVTAFQCNITTQDVFDTIEEGSVDITTLIFVLSAIHPDKFEEALRNIHRVLKHGGVLLFRDYGLYDMTQLRFIAGCKIYDNFYVRQDGTRTYYFSLDFMRELINKIGFNIVELSYVHRRTVNRKENVDVGRIFIQGRFQKC